MPAVDFQAARDAGLTPADLSALFKVHRVTCSRWLNGHRTPHFHLVSSVSRVLDAVRKAVDTGQLPVPLNVSLDDRRPYIQAVLAKVEDQARQA